jgi:N-methylhydantoinase B
LRVRSGGGGGFGRAIERDPAAVLSDVEAGYVSVEQARSAYGVVLREDRSIDVTATAALRETESGRSAG